MPLRFWPTLSQYIEGPNAINEKAIDQIEDDISDEALEAAGVEVAGAWTFVCTMGCDVIEPGPSSRQKVGPTMLSFQQFS
jgi:hypothetical protein